MNKSELNWAKQEVMNFTPLATTSNHRGCDRLIKFSRHLNTAAEGAPTLGSVGLPAGPVQAKFFRPAGPAGPAGSFVDLFDFDWRIYLSRVPTAALEHLLPRDDSRVTSTM